MTTIQHIRRLKRNEIFGVPILCGGGVIPGTEKAMGLTHVCCIGQEGSETWQYEQVRAVPTVKTGNPCEECHTRG